jgi:hypothetical protein
MIMTSEVVRETSISGNVKEQSCLLITILSETPKMRVRTKKAI